MLSTFFTLLFAVASVVSAQSSSNNVVCVAGQCLQGVSNTTIGVTVSAPGAAAKLLLLPGQYTSTTNPQFIHDILSTNGASLSPSQGFTNSSSSSSVSLPLNVALQPGMSIYSSSLYSGQAEFSELPTSPAPSNQSTPISAASLFISQNVWVAVKSGSNNRLILWDSIPDMTQLPTTTTSSSGMSLHDMQSSSCSPPCAGSGICSAQGTCTCPTGFNGTSCETCASGFFGPTCQPCPAGCTKCDDGIAGSGRCLILTVTNPPSSCNCVNGECGANGQCTCLPGWTSASNGSACSKCTTGFFQDSTGNCQACQLGCSQCADQTGDCISCASGFTQDPSDATKCDATPQTSSSGAACPDGSFSNSGTCTPCSTECKTCNGGTSNNCIICNSGKVSLNGACVTTDGNGVCEGSNLIANNNKNECDSCGLGCTKCGIPNFNVASTIDQAQCTACLPGLVLSQGKCVASCPTGTFLSPTDNLTCTACDSSCSSCVGSSTFCLTCSNNQLASSGKCVSSCPSNSFSSSGVCTTCHPDCATCSGSAFNQCSSCSSNLPVLTNGRCLPTCSKSQFFDQTSSTCQNCDSSCSSCSGSGPSNCLACSSSSQVLRGGSCVSASCSQSSNVVPGLGVCLSDLVDVPKSSGTNPSAPLPSITGLNSPTVISNRRPLEWWEILLMTLGCAFIFLMVLLCWRRRARKNRAKDTARFASAKALDRNGGNWFVRFGEKLFGHAPWTGKVALREDGEESEEIKLMKLREAEEARHEEAMEKLIETYEYSNRSSHHSHSHERHSRAFSDSTHSYRTRLSDGSLYSQVTGLPRRTAEPRQPVRDKSGNLLSSRFSVTTSGSSSRARELTPPPLPTTDAEAIAASFRASPKSRGGYWISGGSSKNPFRKS